MLVGRCRGQRLGVSAEDRLYGAALRSIAQRRRRRVHVDGIDVTGEESAFFQHVLHGKSRAEPVRVGRRHMVGIGRRSDSEDFSVDPRASIAGRGRADSRAAERTCTGLP